MDWHTVRALILGIGWPFLLVGSGYALCRAWRFHRQVRRRALGWLVWIMALGWLLTMYSLGITATWWMMTAAGAAVPVVLPIFLVWLITMVAILRAVERWMKEAAALNDLHDELQRANRDLQEFAYVASHDLREPVRMIAATSELLARRDGAGLSAEGRRRLAVIQESARRMHALVEGLLQYSRTGTVIHADVDLRDVVEHIRTDLGPALADTDAILETGMLPIVQGDPVQIRQLLQNLVTNALKFRADETPRIRISSEERPDEWLIEVTDNGSGIEPRERERVFEIFHRGGDRDVEGAGMGLAICRRVVERHGGRIWTSDGESGGTVFHFTLPRAA